MSLKDEIILEAGSVFDEIRPEFFPGGTCYLIKKNGVSANFSLVLEITDRWWVRFNKYRFKFDQVQDEFQFARQDSEFKDAIAHASHIALRTVVYGIDPKRRSVDILEPEGTTPWWFVYCNLAPDLSYTFEP